MLPNHVNHLEHFVESTFLIMLPVWFRNRFISAGLEPVLSYTEKLWIADNLSRILK